nr:hypothetical protein HUO10_005294 [Paraburkholderia busanensis]
MSSVVGSIAARPRSCSSTTPSLTIASCWFTSHPVVCAIKRRAANRQASACSMRSGISTRAAKVGGNSSHSCTSGAPPVAQSSCSSNAMPQRFFRPARGSRISSPIVPHPMLVNQSAYLRAGGRRVTGSADSARKSDRCESARPPPCRASSHAPSPVGATANDAVTPIVSATRLMARSIARTPPKSRRLAETSTSTVFSAARVTCGENRMRPVASAMVMACSRAGSRSRR